jgi:hypothetical protein
MVKPTLAKSLAMPFAIPFAIPLAKPLAIPLAKPTLAKPLAKALAKPTLAKPTLAKALAKPTKEMESLEDCFAALRVSDIKSASVEETMESVRKANSQVAKDGNSAEKVLCTDLAARALLSAYFGKAIVLIECIKGRKKSDNRILFEDGTSECIQIKSGTGGGRGWSCDRRSVDLLPFDEAGRSLIGVVCLKKDGARETAALPRSTVSTFLLGTEVEYQPTYFLHVRLDGERLLDIAIAPQSVVLEALEKDLYETLVAKRTCVHLSPLLYLQRKGGGKKDHAPDHIQLKLKCLPPCMTVLTDTSPPDTILPDATPTESPLETTPSQLE